MIHEAKETRLTSQSFVDSVEQFYSVARTAPGHLYEVRAASGLDAKEFEYSDLRGGRSPRLAGLDVVVDAVWEVDRRPVLYVVKGSVAGAAPSEQGIDALSCLLAARGYPACMAVIDGGLLKLYPCVLGGASSQETRLPAEETLALLTELAEGIERENVTAAFQAARDVDVGDRLLTLFRNVADTVFHALADIFSDQALRTRCCLALMGRAIFTRFLFDRNILNAATAPALFVSTKGTLPNWFGSDKETVRLFNWLDRTFNGDFLPLGVDALFPEKTPAQQYEAFLGKLPAAAKSELRKIVLNVDLNGQASFLFDDEVTRLDYAHIPVGLLSEVYEDFTHTFDGDNAKKHSRHYTPREIARLMVDQVFDAMPPEQRMMARVLDPSSGAGIFLVLTLRRLAQERWRQTGQRPTAQDIRDILYNQIRGFDQDRSALTLATLSLYLASVELTWDPLPPEKLTFPRPLLGRVLVDVSGTPLGSLDASLRGHNRGYDVVIGNPPWTSLSKNTELISVASSIAERVMKARDLAAGVRRREYAYKIHDHSPDVPFVWRAMEWAKPNGVIAFALHGRILFQTSESAIGARLPLFRYMKVTGILNASDLADERNVWPGMAQHFCLLFARNVAPKPNEPFRVLNTHRDLMLNRLGRLRLDPMSVNTYTLREWEQEPWLLKASALGTQFDVQVVRKLLGGYSDRPVEPIGNYWRRLGLASGKGYQVASKRLDARHIVALNGVDLNTDSEFTPVLNAGRLEKFERKKLHSPRDPAIYRTPMVVVKEAGFSPKERSLRAATATGKTPVIFSESFVGYSTSGYRSSARLANYLRLILNSRLCTYALLMTDAKLGAERRAVTKLAIDNFPIIPLEALSSSEVRELETLAAQMNRSAAQGSEGIALAPEYAERLDCWVERLYGLTEDEQEAIGETLKVALPYKEQWRETQRVPSVKEKKAFANWLAETLNPILSYDDLVFKFTAREDLSSDSWVFLSAENTKLQKVEALTRESVLVRLSNALATNSGSSMVFVKLDSGNYLIGILAQWRYFTKTRARLAAQAFLGELESNESVH